MLRMDMLSKFYIGMWNGRHVADHFIGIIVSPFWTSIIIQISRSQRA